MKETRRIEFAFEIFRIIVALAIAYGITLLCIMLISDDPGQAVYMFAIGPFTTVRRLGQLFGKFIPYLLTGAGMCFIYASNRFNLIGEGVYLISGCLVTLVSLLLQDAGIPHMAFVLLLVLVGAGVGAAFGAVPAVLREKRGINETVVSIMLNWALLYLATFIVKTVMSDTSITYLASAPIPESAKLTTLVSRTQLHSGLFIGLIAVLITSLIFYRTSLGYSIRICGSNPRFAKATGINMTRTLIAAQVLGAMLSGIGGAVDILGIYDRYMWTALTNMGFDGLLVAVLAKKNPVFVPLGAFLLAYMRTGASILNYTSSIPIELVDIMQAIIILLIAAEHFLGGYKEKLIFKASRARNKEVAR